MAKNVANEKVEPIVLTDNDTGERFTLEFSRESVVFTNRQGFNVSEMGSNSMEMLPILFYGAFRMHHRNVSRQRTDKILFEDLGGLSSAAVERLLMLYNAPHSALIRSEEDEPKNAKMTIQL